MNISSGVLEQLFNDVLSSTQVKFTKFGTSFTKYQQKEWCGIIFNEIIADDELLTDLLKNKLFESYQLTAGDYPFISVNSIKTSKIQVNNEGLLKISFVESATHEALQDFIKLVNWFYPDIRLIETLQDKYPTFKDVLHFVINKLSLNSRLIMSSAESKQTESGVTILCHLTNGIKISLFDDIHKNKQYINISGIFYDKEILVSSAWDIQAISDKFASSIEKKRVNDSFNLHLISDTILGFDITEITELDGSLLLQEFIHDFFVDNFLITPKNNKLSNKIKIGIITQFGFDNERLIEIIQEQFSEFLLEDNICVERFNESAQYDLVIAASLQAGFDTVSKKRLLYTYSKEFNIPKESVNYNYNNIMNCLNDEQVISYMNHVDKYFHTADYFINYASDFESLQSIEKLRQQINRLANLVFANPYITPTKDELAMYMAFTVALSSADLSRQVGAVVSNAYGDIIATGTNEIPLAGGGVYSSCLDINNSQVFDISGGRDYTRGYDSNKIEIGKIASDILCKLNLENNAENIAKIIEESKLGDLTEFGRVVHAEMSALMSVARNNISSKEATIYVTTFPCHNCAKHIIASGIKRVVYIEPYHKSKTLEFYTDSVVYGAENEYVDKINLLHGIKNKKVVFENFIGVGPSLFRTLFAMKDGSKKITRKDKKGYTIRNWSPLYKLN